MNDELRRKNKYIALPEAKRKNPCPRFIRWLWRLALGFEAQGFDTLGATAYASDVAAQKCGLSLEDAAIHTRFLLFYANGERMFRESQQAHDFAMRRIAKSIPKLLLVPDSQIRLDFAKRQ